MSTPAAPFGARLVTVSSRGQAAAGRPHSQEQGGRNMYSGGYASALPPLPCSANGGIFSPSPSDATTARVVLADSQAPTPRGFRALESPRPQLPHTRLLSLRDHLSPGAGQAQGGSKGVPEKEEQTLAGLTLAVGARTANPAHVHNLAHVHNAAASGGSFYAGGVSGSPTAQGTLASSDSSLSFPLERGVGGGGMRGSVFPDPSPSAAAWGAPGPLQPGSQTAPVDSLDQPRFGHQRHAFPQQYRQRYQRYGGVDATPPPAAPSPLPFGASASGGASASMAIGVGLGVGGGVSVAAAVDSSASPSPASPRPYGLMGLGDGAPRIITSLVTTDDVSSGAGGDVPELPAASVDTLVDLALGQGLGGREAMSTSTSTSTSTSFTGPPTTTLGLAARSSSLADVSLSPRLGAAVSSSTVVSSSSFSSTSFSLSSASASLSSASASLRSVPALLATHLAPSATAVGSGSDPFHAMEVVFESTKGFDPVIFAPSLVMGSDVPPWQRAPYISSSYRSGYSALQCARSVVEWHNETCNVWTHLIGLFLFLGVALYRYETVLAAAPLQHQLAFLTFYCTVCCCMLLSAGYHLFSCINESLHDMLYRLDMTGICLMVFGSYLPGIAVAFTCYPGLAKVYAAAITTIIAAVIICQNLSACLHPRWFVLRICTTLASVVFAIIPCSHFYLLSPYEHIMLMVPVVTCTIMLYGAGFVVWLFKFPERYWPGKFDMILNSHNIWHTFVVLAPLAWDFGLHSILRVVLGGKWLCPSAASELLG